jgi:hypothetical protein
MQADDVELAQEGNSVESVGWVGPNNYNVDVITLSSVLTTYLRKNSSIPYLDCHNL